MTDRELLELAAKAAGIEFIPERSSNDMLWLVGGGVWSPKHDDGDALRLAVACDIPIGKAVYRESWARTNTLEDACAATRRAIVCAAAEVQRVKENNDADR